MTSSAQQTAREPELRMNAPWVSIVINNYNYGRFLPEAINSAMRQRYEPVEVIVVDDGSTDNSRAVIAEYATRIKAVLKSNGGQASALNAGFAASGGDIVLFLDADDILFPDAAANAVLQLADHIASKVHWPMWVVDSGGNRTGETRPPHAPPAGDFRQRVLERGPSNVASSPTSGNAWSRSFLARVMPIPEDVAYYRACADEYLYTLAPVFGMVRAIAEPQGFYRVHGGNTYSSLSFRQKLALELDGYEEQCAALQHTLARNGIHVDAAPWKRHSWFHLLDRAIERLERTIPPHDRFVLIDGGTWSSDWHSEHWRARPFFEVEGVDWGPPADSQSAIEQLIRLMDDGVEHLVLAWPSFWWLDEYPDFFRFLRRCATCRVRDEAIQIYELARRQSGALRRLESGVSAIRGGR